MRAGIPALLIAGLLSQAFPWTRAIQAKLHLLDAHLYPDAVCMDGSQSGYYFQPALNASDATKWIVHLQGGGECTTKQLCDERIGTPLFSSKYWAEEQGLGFYNYVNATANPAFWSWNHVQVEYCTQDLHSGTMSTPAPERWGYRFAGRHVFAAVLDDLARRYNFNSSTEIVLSGDSAGGMGVWLNLRYLTTVAPPSAIIGGAPIAGFYFDVYPYTGPGATRSYLADFSAEAWPGHVKLWGAAMDTECEKALGDDSAACMVANTSYAYMPRPMMVAEALTDQVVLLYHDSLPKMSVWQQPQLQYMAQWQRNMTAGLTRLAQAAPLTGIFAPACFIHTGFHAWSPQITRGGQVHSYYTVAAAWWAAVTGAQGARPQVILDDCGVLCNPTCPHTASLL